MSTYTTTVATTEGTPVEVSLTVSTNPMVTRIHVWTSEDIDVKGYETGFIGYTRHEALTDRLAEILDAIRPDETGYNWEDAYNQVTEWLGYEPEPDED